MITLSSYIEEKQTKQNKTDALGKLLETPKAMKALIALDFDAFEDTKSIERAINILVAKKLIDKQYTTDVDYKQLLGN